MGVLRYGAGFFATGLVALLGALWWREIKIKKKGKAA
jgi:hypothetical protein